MSIFSNLPNQLIMKIIKTAEDERRGKEKFNKVIGTIDSINDWEAFDHYDPNKTWRGSYELLSLLRMRTGYYLEWTNIYADTG